MTKVSLREEAVKLRKDGNSYNLIRRRVTVSKSTLTVWLRDVPFSPNKEVQNRIRGAALRVSEWSHKNKELSVKTAQRLARKKLGIVSRRDLFLLGLGLYIGEGTKSRGNVRVINSDPRVVSLAVRWFEEIFGLKTKNFSLTIHLYPDNDIEEALNFWAHATGIPRGQFGKVQIDRRKKKLKKRGMLQYGTAQLRVHSRGEKKFGVLLFRIIIALIDEAYRQND